MEDSFFTIQEDTESLFKDRGSKFIGYARSVATEEEVQAFLEYVKKEHNKARHHCYAYRLGMDQNNFRANDDGEPSGTAGRPILGQIDSANLTNVMVIVVRYFGGTKLGTSGLINAYKESTRLALELANPVEKIIEDRIRLTFQYGLMSDVMNAVKKIGASVYKQDFGNEGVVEIGIRQSETEDTLLRFRALVLQVSLDHAREIEEIEDLDIEIL